MNFVSSDKRITHKHPCKGRKDEIRAKISKLQQCAPRFIDVKNGLEVGIQNIKKLNDNVQSFIQVLLWCETLTP